MKTSMNANDLLQTQQERYGSSTNLKNCFNVFYYSGCIVPSFSASSETSFVETRSHNRSGISYILLYRNPFYCFTQDFWNWRDVVANGDLTASRTDCILSIFERNYTGLQNLQRVASFRNHRTTLDNVATTKTRCFSFFSRNARIRSSSS